MPRRWPVALLLTAVAAPLGLPGQSRAGGLIDSARAQIAARHLDSADALLRTALDTATRATPGERKMALVWQGIVRFFLRGEDEARATFRQAFAIDPTLDVGGLERFSPELAQLFQQEKEAAARQSAFYPSGRVDSAPRRLTGPPLAYPLALAPRHVQGRVDVAVMVDTAGHVEPASVEILSTPDSGLNEAVRRMMLASEFSPGRVKGKAVRTMVQLGIPVRLPRLSAIELTTTARAALQAGRADSALALVTLALDTTLTHPTEGEQAYALLVRAVAASHEGRDSAAQADRAAGLAQYQELIARRVDLAPVVRRLADSIRQETRAVSHARADMAAPIALGELDEPPQLLSHGTIHYPRELEALRVGGTVVVEAQLDSAGHVAAGSLRVVESSNHGFDAEALRAVSGTVYRPARSHGRPVRATIRQAITFAGY